MKELLSVIAELKAPKNQRNNFGNYNYRSCEDILEAVKPLLLKHSLMMSINDDVVSVLDRVYVKATVTVWNDKESKQVSAFAREAETKKGMDESQITGAASSYARKYALNGMFLIDDTKDADTQNNTKKDTPEKTTPPKTETTSDKASVLGDCIKLIKNSGFDEPTTATLRKKYAEVKTLEQAESFKAEVEKLISVKAVMVDDFKDDSFDDSDIPFGVVEDIPEHF